MPKIQTYKSTKTYDHNEGLSCVFRQWKATDTHCQYLHGYALKFRIVFGCTTLDERNWVQNFGGLKPLKEWLHHMFDHTLLVAEDDPNRMHLEDLHTTEKLAQVRLVPAVGCEQIAKLVYDWINDWLDTESNRVWCESVEVSEHSGNSAIYERKSP